jgi:hypothetical protein
LSARWAVDDHEIRQTLRFAEPREPVDGRAFFEERYRRIAAIAWVSNLRLRFSGFGACFDFAQDRYELGRRADRLCGRERPIFADEGLGLDSHKSYYGTDLSR